MSANNEHMDKLLADNKGQVAAGAGDDAGRPGLGGLIHHFDNFNVIPDPAVDSNNNNTNPQQVEKPQPSFIANAPPMYKVLTDDEIEDLVANISPDKRAETIEKLKAKDLERQRQLEEFQRAAAEQKNAVIREHLEEQERVRQESLQIQREQETAKQIEQERIKTEQEAILQTTIERQTGQAIPFAEFGGNYDEHALWNSYGKAGEAPKIVFNKEIFWEYVMPYEYRHRKDITATHMIGAFLAVSILALSLYNAHEQGVIQNGFDNGTDGSDASSFDHAQSALHYFTSSLGGLIIGAAVIYVVIKAFERSQAEAAFATQKIAADHTKYGSTAETETVKDKDGYDIKKSVATLNAEAAASFGKWGAALTALGAIVSSGFLYAALYAKDSGDVGVAAMLSAPIGAVLLIMGAQQYSHRAKCEEKGMKNKVYKKDSAGNIEDYFAGAVALLFTGIIFYCTNGLHESSSSPNAAQNMNDTLEMASRLASALFVLTGIVGGLIMGNKAANEADKKFREAPVNNKPTLNANKVNHNLTILWALAGLGASLGSLALHLIAGASVQDRMGGAGLAAIACVCFGRAGMNSAKSSNNKWIEMKPMAAGAGMK